MLCVSDMIGLYQMYLPNAHVARVSTSICPNGGFPTLRHNEVRDITADLLTETYDVAVEPVLHPLDGEIFQRKTAITDEEARLDVSARGVWQHAQHAFFDIRVFYPNTRSNLQSSSLASTYRNHECEKKDHMRNESKSKMGVSRL